MSTNILYSFRHEIKDSGPRAPSAFYSNLMLVLFDTRLSPVLSVPYQILFRCDSMIRQRIQDFQGLNDAATLVLKTGSAIDLHSAYLTYFLVSSVFHFQDLRAYLSVSVDAKTIRAQSESLKYSRREKCVPHRKSSTESGRSAGSPRHPPRRNVNYGFSLQ